MHLYQIGMWRSPVAHTSGGRGVASSNLVIPTKSKTIYDKTLMVFFMEYFVYILKSAKKSKNAMGSSQDVKARFKFNSGARKKQNRHRTPFILVFVENWPDKHSALLRERQIK